MLQEGEDVALLANGVMVGRAMDAAKSLAEQGVKARVLNMSSMKPLDQEAVMLQRARHAGS